MRPAFAGKCVAVAVACAEFAAEPVRVWQCFSFPTRSMGKWTCVLCCHRSCEIYICHCLGFEKKRRRMQKEGDIWMGIAIPLVGFLLRWAVAAVTMGSWPPRASHKASAALTMAMAPTMASAVLWFPTPTASCMDGSRQIKNIETTTFSSGLTPWGCCLSFPMRMLGMRPCISMVSPSYSKKVGLPFAFSELPKHNFFQKIKRLIRFIDCVKNVLKDFPGQAGQSIGIPEFLRFDVRWGRTTWPVPPHRKGKAWSERSLLPRWSDHYQIETCCERKQKREQTSNCRELFPGRKKERRSHFENTQHRKKNSSQEQKQKNGALR